jgi:hypothetical protein
MTTYEALLGSVERLDKWLSTYEWKAYDPFDGLNARGLRSLTFGNRLLQIVLQQTVRRFPINLRPPLGIRKRTSSKGMGFCALGYLRLYEATQQEIYLARLKHCLRWLKENPSPGYAGYAWGNHFNYAARGGVIPLGVPSIVWTSWIGNVFFDAFEALGEPEYLSIAQSSCEFILNDIGRYTDPDGTFCFMYTPRDRESPSPNGCIHNSNVLAAWLLARHYKHTQDKQTLGIADRALSYTAKHQLENGAWYYGVPRKFWWVDNFHTGYVLEAFHGYIRATGDPTYQPNVVRGYDYFTSTFFEEDGTPRYYNSKTYPIDIQCASQAIQTLVNLRPYNGDSLGLAKKVARWTIDHMQDKDGHFYFRRYPFITNKTPTFHWGQATMLAALASLLASDADAR